MKYILLTFICLFSIHIHAQPPEMELNANGFKQINVKIPETTNEQLLSLTKNWAISYNRNKDSSADITNVSNNSMTITAYKQNAFYYSNKGETFYHRIKYEMTFKFNRDSYNVTFTITEIYLNDDSLLEYKIPDYFNSDGKLKDDYNTLKESLEETVNDIVNSHYNFIINYR
ncbi:hypothetical protein GCM10007424_12600 [Flavobacterium suaedae]|uniref:DUF4468 domain-containing protein n=1 Tax=Flavobacterium suaedae TaxID=1767027 RepID=A0ABQ1JPE5_9FLAO|nr:DUF4468 domain-containing protein [Flavobacterium suaedae]GGB74160.1 hypothetical protein GCM10007424_12600 [Flavobacterium suaedae]